MRKHPSFVVNVSSFLLSGAHGVREEPRFVTARAGESVILGCDVSPPLDGQQPPYVVEWFKFGVPIPFFINFRFYPPHVDPEYTGEMSVRCGEDTAKYSSSDRNPETLFYLKQIQSFPLLNERALHPGKNQDQELPLLQSTVNPLDFVWFTLLQIQSRQPTFTVRDDKYWPLKSEGCHHYQNKRRTR